MPRNRSIVALAPLLLLAACGNLEPYDLTEGQTGSTGGDASSGGAPTTGSTGSTGGEIPDPEAKVDWPTLECDPLDPNYCLFPFPSNVYTTADATTPTGRRLALATSSLPVSSGGTMVETDGFTTFDGFAGGLPGMVHMPGATIKGLAGPLSIERSVTTESPTIVLDVETGELVPHFAELDMSHADDARRALIIRPVVRPRDGARYIFAVRHVVDASDQMLAPSPAFAALRDRTPFPDDPSIDARRPLYVDIFKRLADVGVPREDLQLAWDYTVASAENTPGRLLHIRDDALAQVGAAGPAYTIKSITEDCYDNIALCVEGEMTVPLYLDKPGAGARMILDGQGMPTQNGTAAYPFTALIPKSAFVAPSRPVAYGHGLLGARDQVGSQAFRDFAEQYNYILFAVDWIGMAGDDYLNIVSILTYGTLHDFQSVVDRGQQGILNFMLATRMMLGDFAADPQLVYQGKPALFDDSAFYFGNSQGGIFGASLMAVQVDVTRGMLGVPGQPYNLLLNRSVDFATYFVLLQAANSNFFDIQILLGAMQMLWDRSEPDGYAPYLSENLLPGTPAHNVLLHVAIGDYQVTPLGAHLIARTINAKNTRPVNRELFGIADADAPFGGNGLTEFDFGLPAAPTTNTPPTGPDDDDPHDKVRKLQSSIDQTDTFLRTGVVMQYCGGRCQGK